MRPDLRPIDFGVIAKPFRVHGKISTFLVDIHAPETRWPSQQLRLTYASALDYYMNWFNSVLISLELGQVKCKDNMDWRRFCRAVMDDLKHWSK